MRPRDPTSISQAAWILGCSRSTVQRRIRDGRLAVGDPRIHGRLSRAVVEQMASETYPWQRHLQDSYSYWVTGQDAADLLGVSLDQLDHLAESDQVPFLVHTDGTRLFRRQQLETAKRRRRPPSPAGTDARGRGSRVTRAGRPPRKQQP